MISWLGCNGSDLIVYLFTTRKTRWSQTFTCNLNDFSFSKLLISFLSRSLVELDYNHNVTVGIGNEIYMHVYRWWIQAVEWWEHWEAWTRRAQNSRRHGIYWRLPGELLSIVVTQDNSNPWSWCSFILFTFSTT